MKTKKLIKLISSGEQQNAAVQTVQPKLSCF